MTTKKQQKRSNAQVWIIPAVLILVLILGVGGYYAYSTYTEEQEKKASESSASASASASESAELEVIRQAVEISTFYQGIFINDIDCSGKTREEVGAILVQQDAEWRKDFCVNLKYGETIWKVMSADTELSSDWEAILEQAWQTGRTSEAANEEDQIRERFSVVQALADNPLKLAVSQTYNASHLIDKILALANAQSIEPLPAIVTGFDRSTKEFIIEDKQPGLKLDGPAAALKALEFLKAGEYGKIVTFQSADLDTGIDAASLKAKLGLVSTGLTKTKANQNPNRAHNITLICKTLNTVYLLPGEVFSFNGYIGERTKAKGYLEAGGILGGVLEEDVVGGGICQPNTTLFQAVLKADLEIVKRIEHSFPSTYTEVGLDATVSWPSKDFQFKNNTEYPVAIVAYYDKPNVVVKVYGRLLDVGVTIELKSVITEKNPCTDPPVEQFDPELPPGVRIQARPAYDEIRTTAYKLWMKDGEVFKKEETFKSYYKDFPELYRYGPPLPTPTPTPPPEPTPTPTETSSEPSETTAETSAASG